MKRFKKLSARQTHLLAILIGLSCGLLIACIAIGASESFKAQIKKEIYIELFILQHSKQAKPQMQTI